MNSHMDPSWSQNQKILDQRWPGPPHPTKTRGGHTDRPPVKEPGNGPANGPMTSSAGGRRAQCQIWRKSSPSHKAQRSLWKDPLLREAPVARIKPESKKSAGGSMKEKLVAD